MIFNNYVCFLIPLNLLFFFATRYCGLFFLTSDLRFPFLIITTLAELQARLEKYYHDKRVAEEQAKIRAEEERLRKLREEELRKIKIEKRKQK